MVVMLRRAAAAVESFTGITSEDIDLMSSGHLAELVVDGGQRDGGARIPNAGMEVLGRTKGFFLFKGLLDRLPLASPPDGRSSLLVHIKIVTVPILVYDGQS